MLAHEFVNQGHELKLITQTPAEQIDQEPAQFPFAVIRQPPNNELLDLVSWCDVFFHNNISLRVAWAIVMRPKPWVIAHHTWMRQPDGSLGWQNILKRSLTLVATNIAISEAIAKHMPGKSTIIGNPYQDDIFYKLPAVKRDRELIFLGRLVSDKGVDILLQALALLKERGTAPQLTIVGDGEELANLQRLTQDLQLGEQVDFVGQKSRDQLAQLLNAHQIMVIPSRWEEPFGVVALEGIACGCVVVGSAGGGLKDAIGSCGLTFANGDTKALAEILYDLLLQPEQLTLYRKNAAAHLANHRIAKVAGEYLKVLSAAIAK
ncbi:glycosyl transferase group 1 [Thalassoporum mexicanum PCC 7367]|nr:glycosyl transferase group 1 [Pseudanabaena sp. PCC 7367]